MREFIKYNENIKIFKNTNSIKSEYTHQDILSLKGFEKAKNMITTWENYLPTKLENLKDVAIKTNVNSIYYKNESSRFGLNSFKALGGAYAVANLLIKELKKLGIDANCEDLIAKKYLNQTKDIHVTCATDGNHGKSVAWGASLFGCECTIYIHADVSVNRKKEIEKYNAFVLRVDGNYDESVKQASLDAMKNNWFVVSDTSYDGYLDVPKDVMQGYSVMVDEAINQLEGVIPTHIFIQGGVGGLAAAVCSYVWEKLGNKKPIFTVVEPEVADCLFKSAQAGKPVIVDGKLDTIMAGLACGEVSLLAWDILKEGSDYFITINDDSAKDTMRLLASQLIPIIAGESAVAGLSAFLTVASDKEKRSLLQIDENSIILFFGSEGDTDKEVYKSIIGKSSEELLNENQSKTIK